MEENNFNIAQMLREITDKSSNKESIADIIEKAKQAASKGKSSIKISSNEEECNYIRYNNRGQDIPAIVTELRQLGFKIKAESYLNFFFSRKYYLILNW